LNDEAQAENAANSLRQSGERRMTGAPCSSDLSGVNFFGFSGA